MKVRFQADADLNHVILLAVLRREPVDFRSAVAANLDALADRSVLSLAAREGRVLVTHDPRTMPQHFAEHVVAESSAGLIVVLAGPTSMGWISRDG